LRIAFHQQYLPLLLLVALRLGSYSIWSCFELETQCCRENVFDIGVSVDLDVDNVVYVLVNVLKSNAVDVEVVDVKALNVVNVKAIDKRILLSLGGSAGVV